MPVRKMSQPPRNLTDLRKSATIIDAGGGGPKHRMARVGAGVLFVDTDREVKLSQKREYVFTERDPTAKDYMAALRSKFDGNRNGKMSLGYIRQAVQRRVAYARPWMLHSHFSNGILAFAMILACTAVRAEVCLQQVAREEFGAEEFLKEYVDVAVNPNACLLLGETEGNCEVYITRHRSNFFFGLEGVEVLSEDVMQSVARQITLTSSEVGNSTGIHGYAKPEASNDSVIAIVFIDPDEAKRDPSSFAASKLAWLTIAPPETLTSILSAFIEAEGSDCIALNKDDSKGNLLVSSTWINSSISPDEINQCVVRAFVGGMGLVADGLFVSDGISVENTASGLYSVPGRYQSFLAVHYNSLVRPGMTRDQVDGNETIAAELNCGR